MMIEVCRPVSHNTSLSVAGLNQPALLTVRDVHAMGRGEWGEVSMGRGEMGRGGMRSGFDKVCIANGKGREKCVVKVRVV